MMPGRRQSNSMPRIVDTGDPMVIRVVSQRVSSILHRHPFLVVLCHSNIVVVNLLTLGFETFGANPPAATNDYRLHWVGEREFVRIVGGATVHATIYRLSSDGRLSRPVERVWEEHVDENSEFLFVEDDLYLLRNNEMSYSLEVLVTKWRLPDQPFTLLATESDLFLYGYRPAFFDGRILITGGCRIEQLGAGKRIHDESFENIRCFDVEKRRFGTVSTIPDTGEFPAPREDHTTVLHEESLYVFGGNGMGDMWRLCRTDDVLTWHCFNHWRRAWPGIALAVDAFPSAFSPMYAAFRIAPLFFDIVAFVAKVPSLTQLAMASLLHHVPRRLRVRLEGERVTSIEEYARHLQICLDAT